MVQEYERAVIFRLGRLVAGGAKGPGKWAFTVPPVFSNFKSLSLSRSFSTRNILHPALHWCLRPSRPANENVRCTTAGGEFVKVLKCAVQTPGKQIGNSSYSQNFICKRWYKFLFSLFRKCSTCLCMCVCSCLSSWENGGKYYLVCLIILYNLIIVTLYYIV